MYWPLLNLFGLALLATPIVANLGVLWVAVELTTVVSALLVTSEGTDQSLEAGWKYIVIGSAGLALGLLGIVLIYAAGIPSLGDHYTPTYTILAGAGPHLSRPLIYTGFAFVLVGFGTKVGLVPMHAWLPDAHSEGPSPISAMLSGALLAAALYAVLRLGAIAQLAVGTSYVHVLLLVFGALSLGARRLLRPAADQLQAAARLLLDRAHGDRVARSRHRRSDRRLRRVLSRRSCTQPARRSRSSAPASLLSRYESREVDDVRGVIRAAPFTGAMVLLGALAIGGVPPFGIFRSELLIVTGGFSRSSFALAGLLVLFANVAFVGLYQVVSPHGPVRWRARGGGDRARVLRREQPLMALAMLVSLAVVLVLGLWIPGPLDRLLHSAVAVIGGRT